MTVLALRALDEETWGERVTRARRRSGLSFKEAAHLVSQFVPTTHATLARLEELVAVPSDQRRRVIATLALLAYGFKPEEFDLSLDELPAGIDHDRLDLLVVASSTWSDVCAASGLCAAGSSLLVAS